MDTLSKILSLEAKPRNEFLDNKSFFIGLHYKMMPMWEDAAGEIKNSKIQNS